MLTYSRRGSRLNARQAGRLGAPARRRWWIPDEAVDRPGFDLRSWFGREAPLVVEIGSGVGEATVALAAARPSYDVLAFEVWQPGVADTLAPAGAGRCRQRAAAQRRRGVVAASTCSDAGQRATSCGRSSPTRGPRSGTTGAGWSTPSFAAPGGDAGSAPGALWRLATDWADYAEQMVEVLDAEPLLENVHAGRRRAGTTGR